MYTALTLRRSAFAPPSELVGSAFSDCPPDRGVEMNSETDDKQQTEETPPSVVSEDRIEGKIDRDLQDSFPASDPPGWVLGVKRTPAEKEEEADSSPSGATGDTGGG